jgi:hypothetical protein
MGTDVNDVIVAWAHHAKRFWEAGQRQGPDGKQYDNVITFADAYKRVAIDAIKASAIRIPKGASEAEIQKALREPYSGRLKLIALEELIKPDSNPDEYSIKGLAPAEGIGVTWGPSGTYKSFLELDLGLHHAVGWQYRGRRTKQGPVVYCAFEGGRGVKKRVAAWCKKNLAPDFAGDVPFYLQPLKLDLAKEVDELIDAIGGQLGGADPVRISLDTLNRSMVGSESSDEDMAAYFGAADKLREAFRCFVNIITRVGIRAACEAIRACTPASKPRSRLRHPASCSP